MRILILVAALSLTGCASVEYKAYADAHAAAAHARAQADVARYAALADIARNGDGAAKVAAAMSLALQGSNAAPQQSMAAPRSWHDTMLGWAGVLMPSLTQMYASNRSAALGMAQSSNSAAVAVSTNNTMLGIASRIQAPGQVTTITGSYNVDNTHPAQVVTQPAPIIVNQPAPAVVTTGP